LARLLVEFSPVSFEGHSVLDLGSGTGEGSRAALAAGAEVVAVDVVPEMLQVNRASRPPAVAGDAVSLPFRDRAFDVALAAFSLNHLDDPADGVREAGRISSLLLASTYAADDDHPAKVATERALGEVGWERPSWYDALKAAMASWGTVEDASAAIDRGGLIPLRVERREIVFEQLGPRDMVAWRMGLAQSATFLSTLDPAAQQRVARRALDLLGPHPEPIVRRVIFLAAANASH
jgi:SAM-dependent methyltransferase